uniref:Uncharacterized protein n=1 Tax=Tanacetum cinerariifolium TaxID=118510 RepID=A0A6L2MBL8_TANCI|nr:hypothetical protein [Tanacetum cinerariifolium]
MEGGKYFLRNILAIYSNVVREFLGKRSNQAVARCVKENWYITSFGRRYVIIESVSGHFKIVQESRIHTRSSSDENKPNVAVSGPTWLFDIDTLTKTMNYQPVTAGNQSNPSAGFQDKFAAEKAGDEIEQQYVLFPTWSSGSTNPQNTNGNAAFDEKELKFDKKKLEFEVNVSPSSSAQLKKHDDKTKKEAKGKSPVESLTRYRNLSAEFEDFVEIE